MDGPASNTGILHPRLPDVSVILVNYNTSALLTPCLSRLAEALEPLLAQVLIVDNASRDDSVSLLRTLYSRYHIVENKTNIGFGRANNQVLKQALGRYVLLLNTDAFVEPSALVDSIGFMEANPRTGVLGARLVGADGAQQPSCRYLQKPWTEFLTSTGLNRLVPGVRLVDDPAWDPSVTQNCDWVPGCYYMIRRAVITSVGLFDPRFFLYYEEVDHCKSVRDAGWDVTYFCGTTVVHLGGESAKSDSTLSNARQISSLQIESELLFFRKHYGAFGVWLSLLLGFVGDAILFFKGLVRGTGRRSGATAWRHMTLSTAVFRATGAGLRSTR